LQVAEPTLQSSVQQGFGPDRVRYRAGALALRLTLRVGILVRQVKPRALAGPSQQFRNLVTEGDRKVGWP